MIQISEFDGQKFARSEGFTLSPEGMKVGRFCVVSERNTELISWPEFKLVIRNTKLIHVYRKKPGLLEKYRLRNFFLNYVIDLTLVLKKNMDMRHGRKNNGNKTAEVDLTLDLQVCFKTIKTSFNTFRQCDVAVLI